MKTKKIGLLVLPVLVLAVLAAGCGKKAAPPMGVSMERLASRPQAPEMAAEEKMVVGRLGAGGPAPVASDVAAQGPVYAAPQQAVLQAAASQRRLISRAWLTLKVKNVEQGYDKAIKIALEAGGQVGSSSMEKTKDERERSAELVLRVPAESMESVIDKMKGLGEVLSTKREGEDVSEQWVDLAARIHNLQWQEQQLLNIMKEKAKTLDDLLRMQGEVARLRGEIEANEGRMRLLQDQVAMATLTVKLVERETVVEAVPSGSWALNTTFSKALKTALAGARAIVGFFIWFGILGIVWVPIVVILYLLGRYTASRAKKAANSRRTDV